MKAVSPSSAGRNSAPVMLSKNARIVASSVVERSANRSVEFAAATVDQICERSSRQAGQSGVTVEVRFQASHHAARSDVGIAVPTKVGPESSTSAAPTASGPVAGHWARTRSYASSVPNPPADEPATTTRLGRGSEAAIHPSAASTFLRPWWFQVPARPGYGCTTSPAWTSPVQ